MQITRRPTRDGSPYRPRSFARFMGSLTKLIPVALGWSSATGRAFWCVSLLSLWPVGGREVCGGETAVCPAPAPVKADAGPPAPKGPVADNSRCFVCHANYDFNEEKLVFTHAQANIGCVRCHGESSPHSTDEDGLTAPDRMFPLPYVRFNCLGCHDSAKLVASDQARQNRADLKEKPDHQAVLDGTARDKKFCTDCHGEHRLGHRTRKWDKRTSKLIYRDSTPQMLGDPSGSK